MIFILMVSPDREREELSEALSAQGWWVSMVPNSQSALRAAADHQPEVVVVDGEVPGAGDLVKIFSSRNGGPGALVLNVADGDADGFAFVEAGADELLSNSPTRADLVKAIERVASLPRNSTVRTPHLEGRRMTADEIFGDILAEVEQDGESTAQPEVEGGLVPAAVGGEVGEASSVKRETSSEGQVSGDDWIQGESLAASDLFDEEPSESPFDIGTLDHLGEPEQPQIESPESDVTTEESEGTFGQYLLEERIAVGGMAEVWRASMLGLEGFRKTVAIKKILPHLAENEDFVAMFVDEAKLAAQLNHENLVDIYDLGKIDRDFFIAMEYVDGRDLRSILNQLKRHRQTFPIGLACFIAARIAAALDYAHTRSDETGAPLNLVHRDVSPRNILISNAGNIRLCDFGVAKAVSSVARTEIGALKGKIQYMSPEQANGKPVDGRSDVFSLGSVLFEMVTGRRLFVEDSEISLLDAVRSGTVEDPKAVRGDLPESVNKVLLRALSKEPDGRYRTAGDMQSDLEDALYGFDPKPTQLTLAEWVAEVFKEVYVPEASSEPVSPAGPATGEKEKVLTSSAAVEEPAKETDDDERTEITQVISVPRPVEIARRLLRGRWKFWFGVLAGLALAVLAALAVDRLLLS